VLRAVSIAVGLVALAALSGHIAMHRVMEADRVEVPRVIGFDSVAAEALIKEAGLVPRVVAEEFSATIPRGSVTSQRPARGTRVTLGSEVRLILSRGSDQLAAPDLAGLTLAQAKRVVAETGLTLGPVISVHSDAHARESVVTQDPPPGAQVKVGGQVQITIGE
jgi:serine/threonine-protein kinase